MDHYQQTWTTGISAQGEYMWYSSIVPNDVIVMTLLLRGHMTLTNTHISGFREVADTKCGQQVPFLEGIMLASNTTQYNIQVTSLTL